MPDCSRKWVNRIAVHTSKQRFKKEPHSKQGSLSNASSYNMARISDGDELQQAQSQQAKTSFPELAQGYRCKLLQQ